MNKNVCLLLTVLIFFSMIIIACGESVKINDAGNADVFDTNVETEGMAETRKPLGVPTIDYGGYKFRILSINSTVTGKGTHPGNNFYSNFTDVPERAGEPVNDAIHYRNLKITEDYNVEIVNTEVADVYAESRKIIAAGEDAYDIITPFIDNAFKLAQEKYIYNLANVPYLDLKNPWWDQVLVEKLSLNNKIYSIIGDIMMDAKELNWCIVTNKVLMEQYNVSNLYDVVRDGKWTLDKMYEIGLSVTHDLNGDNVIDWDDVYAYGNDYTGNQFFYFAAGENIAVLDSNGYPQLTVGNERSINVVDKITRIFNDTNFMIWVSKIKGEGWTVLRTMFKENRLMIFSLSMYAIKELRGMVDDFAILPGPKYDEQQDKYYMIVSTHACPAVSIPVTVTDLERTGILLEAIAYHSNEVQAAHYDVTLMGKLTRDEESRDMLELIFNSITYDIGKAFGWGAYIGQMATATQKNTGFAALYEQNRAKAEAEIEKSFNIFLEIDG